MLYFPESVPERYRASVVRGRSERAKAISVFLRGAATSVWTLARWGLGGLGWVGRGVVSRAIRARRRHAAIRELEALDDRLLKDIGISRAQIPAVVEGKLAAPRREPKEPTGHRDVTVLSHRRLKARSSRGAARRAA